MNLALVDLLRIKVYEVSVMTNVVFNRKGAEFYRDRRSGLSGRRWRLRLPVRILSVQGQVSSAAQNEPSRPVTPHTLTAYRREVSLPLSPFLEILSKSFYFKRNTLNLTPALARQGGDRRDGDVRDRRLEAL
ncbi:hypothetical protein EVAR_91602_1 [Eumeta japonica]|uniref:Uncharacterized protein n=1 Tax=Eumeta variegata TaxID=151549 RepID=A0A4C1UWK1_EUMVA|nr:hypothetical protein EVAR_91602_1 [Eumeta japonica]